MPEKEGLSHYVLFTYSLSAVSQKQKVKILRELVGYKNVKDKVYNHEGLLQKTNSVKLGSNVIMAPIDKALMFSNFFSSNKIKAEAREIWAN